MRKTLCLLILATFLLIASVSLSHTEVISVQTPEASSLWRVNVAQQNCIRPCVITYYVDSETAKRQSVGGPFR